MEAVGMAGACCPFCGSDDYCPHFLGWTEDGRTFSRPRPFPEKEEIRATDRIVKTGVSARVYRPLKS
jgi:hypothetical protein